MSACPKVSVIVCVYNGESTITQCLDSLLGISYPRDRLEIIVVDNNSTDRTKEIIRKYPVRYVFEKKRAIAVARNTGLRNSSGEFIAFTDADCVVDNNWIANILPLFTDKSIGIAGGKILPVSSDSNIEKYIASMNYYSHCGQENGTPYTLPGIATGNAMIRRSALEESGEFDSASLPYGGEDTDITCRILLKGYKIRYEPNAVVYHKHRSNLASFIKWRFKCGRSGPYILLKYQKIIRVKYRTMWFEEAIGVFLTVIRKMLELAIDHTREKSARLKRYPWLDFFGDMFFYFGHAVGWLELTIGRTRVVPIGSNGLSGVFWWNEKGGGIICIADMTKQEPRYHYLSYTGRRIWELLFLHGKSPDSAADILAGEYDIDRDILKRDSELLAKELEDAGILLNK